MYLITNVSNQEIAISDLGVTLYPKQAIDLDKINTNIDPNKSKDLKIAISKKCLKVLHHTNDSPPQEVVVKNESGFDKDSLMSEIREVIKQEIGSKSQSNQIPEKNNNEDIKELLSEFKSLMQNINSNNSSGNNDNKSDSNIIDDDVDEDKLGEIHAKAVEKITKNTKGTVAYENSKVKDNKMNSNISELEDLF